MQQAKKDQKIPKAPSGFVGEEESEGAIVIKPNTQTKPSFTFLYRRSSVSKKNEKQTRKRYIQIYRDSLYIRRLRFDRIYLRELMQKSFIKLQKNSKSLNSFFDKLYIYIYIRTNVLHSFRRVKDW